MPDKPIDVHVELQQFDDDDAEARQGLERATRLLESIAGDGQVRVEREPTAQPADAKTSELEAIAGVTATIINSALLIEVIKALVAWVGRRRRSATTAAGSSTVEPVIQAVAQEFGERTDGRASVNLSGAGTVNGIAQFCREQDPATALDLVNASRAMTADERRDCRAAGVVFEEFVLGFDGMSVVTSVNSQLALGSVTLEELRRIFGENGVATWDQVREGLPAEPVITCAPDAGSGTHDAFRSLALDGGELRPATGEDVRSSDDNELVQCVQTHSTAIGFFGHAYYQRNQERLRLLEVAREDPDDAVGTSHATVAGGIYPLSRPLLVYVRTESLSDKRQVVEFVRLLLTRAEQTVLDTGYTPTSHVAYTEQLERLETLLG